tara:strand:+ start:201 stop:533 length:333 start_codon:yes stop_codon:yes gene_type:complete
MNQPVGAQVGLKLTGTGESNNVEVRFSAGYKLANGRYEVGQEINRGVTAVVYEGYDSTLRMKVALKVLRPVVITVLPPVSPSRGQLCEEKVSRHADPLPSPPTSFTPQRR